MTNRLRARYLAAMGLPAALAACPREPQPPPVEVPIAAPSTAPTQTASAKPDVPDASAAVATASATATATALPPKPPGPNVASWDLAFPFPAGDRRSQWGCQQHARCFALDDLVHALGGPKVPTSVNGCPASVEVACGCTPGSVCDDRNEPCTAPRADAVSTKESAAKGKAACCYTTPDHCIPPWVGRALRDEHGALATCPPARVRGDWAHELDDGARDAARWERIAAMEHASVASFARASLALLALGAPPELVRDTHLAALDEIEHARLAYGLASSGGTRVGPSPLAVAARADAPADLAAFARATFLDACVGETLGAEAARRESLSARGMGERAVLARIASDEERHAELAWRTVAWCVRQGGGAVQRALAAALEEERARSHEPADVFDAVVVPCVEALLRPEPSPAAA
jgi:hypothetical protein